MNKYKLSSFDLKLALLQRFRFRYGWVCCTEFQGADVIVDTGKEIIEVEVKITKGDLINGERKKYGKHKDMKDGLGRTPNKFFLCVPEKLVDTAKDWVKDVNSNYGIFEFRQVSFEKRIAAGRGVAEHMEYLYQAKSAKILHNNYSKIYQYAIARRASSELAGLMKCIFRNSLNELMKETV